MKKKYFLVAYNDIEGLYVAYKEVEWLQCRL